MPAFASETNHFLPVDIPVLITNASMERWLSTVKNAGLIYAAWFKNKGNPVFHSPSIYNSKE
jgi:hypothetical protein